MRHLNELYNLGLNHHDINFLYGICRSLKNGYYLKIRDPITRLIQCLPNSNRNSVGEFIKMSENWLASELTYPTSPRHISPLFLMNFCYQLNLLSTYSIVSKCFKTDINVVHVWDLNFVLCSKIFVHYNEQHRATHLILRCVPSNVMNTVSEPVLVCQLEQNISVLVYFSMPFCVIAIFYILSVIHQTHINFLRIL